MKRITALFHQFQGPGLKDNVYNVFRPEENLYLFTKYGVVGSAELQALQDARATIILKS